jgi:TP901 family phage tail tape measure protein
MGRVADVLAQASADSNASIESLGQSFKYIAPVANTVGLSIEEAAAALGVLADQGLRGTMAGRNLASGLMFLVTPSAKATNVLKKYNVQVFDSFGNFRNLAEILAELQKLTVGQSEAQQLANIAMVVGKDNAKSYLAILNSEYVITRKGNREILSGVEMINERTKALENANGAAEEMAEIRLNNLSGDLEKLRGDADSLAIAMYDRMQPALRGFVQLANEILTKATPYIIQGFSKIIEFGSIVYQDTNLNLSPVGKEIKQEEKRIEVGTEEPDDDWGAVPAFLRRSKLK